MKVAKSDCFLNIIAIIASILHGHHNIISIGVGRCYRLWGQNIGLRA